MHVCQVSGALTGEDSTCSSRCHLHEVGPGQTQAGPGVRYSELLREARGERANHKGKNEDRGKNPRTSAQSSPGLQGCAEGSSWPISILENNYALLMMIIRMVMTMTTTTTYQELARCQAWTYTHPLNSTTPRESLVILQRKKWGHKEVP